MITVCIQIGNSDDKLSQAEWSDYVDQLKELVSGRDVHFSGGSPTESAWQNYCIVFNVDEAMWDILKIDLMTLRRNFGQVSVAVLVGKVMFI